MTGDAVADRRVHPATVPLRFLKEAPSTLLGLPAAYAFLSRPGIAGVIGFALIIGAAMLAYQWLAWRRFRYGIGAHELVIESGVLSRTRRSIPFDRIQDVDIEQGPLARLFGLARLRIETGGSGSDEGVLDSVTVAEAERLRSALRAARDRSGPWDMPAEMPASELLFEMPLPRLLVAGLFNFSMVYIAGIFALLQAFGDWLPFDLLDRSLWRRVAGADLEERLSVGAVAAVGSIALMLGVITGIIQTVSRDFGFRLTLESEGLRRRRGLFTRSDVLIPRARMQVAVVDTGPIRRMFGFCVLTFQTLSGGGGEGGGSQSAAPLARWPEADRILAEVEGFRRADPASLRIVSSRRIVRRLIALAPLLAAAGLAGFLFWLPILLLLPLLLLAVPAILIERRFHRYGIEDGLLFVQAGIWRQRQWIVPLGRIQSISLSRSWLQRRLGLAAVGIDTAGAPMLGGVRIADLREDLARTLAQALMPAGTEPDSPSN